MLLSDTLDSEESDSISYIGGGGLGGTGLGGVKSSILPCSLECSGEPGLGGKGLDLGEKSLVMLAT